MDVATKLLAMEGLHFHVDSLAWVRAPWLSCASPKLRRVCVRGSPQRKEDAQRGSRECGTLPEEGIEGRMEGFWEHQPHQTVKLEDQKA